MLRPFAWAFTRFMQTDAISHNIVCPTLFAQQCWELLALVAWCMQTNATSHNIVSPTMLGVVGACCVVHANERIKSQHCQPNNVGSCWRLLVLVAWCMQTNATSHNIVSPTILGVIGACLHLLRGAYKRTQRVTTLLAQQFWELLALFAWCMQTNAASYNIVRPAMLGVAGACCVVHANERIKSQHC